MHEQVDETCWHLWHDLGDILPDIAFAPESDDIRCAMNEVSGVKAFTLKSFRLQRKRGISGRNAGLGEDRPASVAA